MLPRARRSKASLHVSDLLASSDSTQFEALRSRCREYFFLNATRRLPEEEVDSTRFVKLFLDGIKQAAGLSKTGMQVFELVYYQMRANPGSDEIKLNQYVARDSGINDRTYQRGVRELLEKQFLYRSTSDGVFFVNIRFMFNGDRLAFVRSYHLKSDSKQAELPFESPPRLQFSGPGPGPGEPSHER